MERAQNDDRRAAEISSPNCRSAPRIVQDGQEGRPITFQGLSEGPSPFQTFLLRLLQMCELNPTDSRNIEFGLSSYKTCGFARPHGLMKIYTAINENGILELFLLLEAIKKTTVWLPTRKTMEQAIVFGNQTKPELMDRCRENQCKV